MPRRSPQADLPHQALGQAIRQARMSQQLTQEELALQSGLHSTQISSLERGHRNPTFGAMREVSRGLGMPLWQLVLLAEEIEEAEEDL